MLGTRATTASVALVAAGQRRCGRRRQRRWRRLDRSAELIGRQVERDGGTGKHDGGEMGEREADTVVPWSEEGAVDCSDMLNTLRIAKVSRNDSRFTRCCGRPMSRTDARRVDVRWSAAGRRAHRPRTTCSTSELAHRHHPAWGVDAERAVQAIAASGRGRGTCRRRPRPARWIRAPRRRGRPASSTEELDADVELVAPEERDRRIRLRGSPLRPPRPAGSWPPPHPARRRSSSARHASPRRTAGSASAAHRLRRKRPAPDSAVARRAHGSLVAHDAVAQLRARCLRATPSPAPRRSRRPRRRPRSPRRSVLPSARTSTPSS